MSRNRAEPGRQTHQVLQVSSNVDIFHHCVPFICVWLNHETLLIFFIDCLRWCLQNCLCEVNILVCFQDFSYFTTNSVCQSTPLDLIETGKSLKVQAERPHLVSLGSGRLSTAITLLPLLEGKLTSECTQTRSTAQDGTNMKRCKPLQHAICRNSSCTDEIRAKNWLLLWRLWVRILILI